MFCNEPLILGLTLFTAILQRIYVRYVTMTSLYEYYDILLVCSMYMYTVRVVAANIYRSLTLGKRQN